MLMPIVGAGNGVVLQGGCDGQDVFVKIREGKAIMKT